MFFSYNFCLFVRTGQSLKTQTGIKIKRWSKLCKIRPIELRESVKTKLSECATKIVHIANETDIDNVLSAERRRRSIYILAAPSKNIETKMDRQQFSNKHSHWGRKRCNCGNSNCKLFSASVLWVCGNVFGSVLRRVPKCVQVDNVKEVRLSFVHFLRWDELCKRPIQTTTPQPWEDIQNLVSKVLAVQQRTLPGYLVSFCKHRGTVTVRPLQDDILPMRNEMTKQQKEVCVLSSFPLINNTNICFIIIVFL